MIDKDLIHRPQMWQLVLEVAPGRLSALALCPLEERSAQVMSVTLDDGDTPLRRLENAVYDNPGLLLDYGAVTVLWRTQRRCLMPDFVHNEGLINDIFTASCPGESADGEAERLTDRWEGLHASLVYEVPVESARFLRRTFYNARMRHALSPLALWLTPRQGHPVPEGRMLVNLDKEGQMDIFVTGPEAPLMVNTYDCPVRADAFYYIMAVRQSLGLAPDREIILAGDARRRAALAPLLRRYVSVVMPAILPASVLRAGAAVLQMPFEVALGATPAARKEAKKQ